ncbi:MAG: hypothetical protein K2P84_05760, partial [Undibacterium sp.]|nr:hypothetical protein [Undibacterium sp.]
LCLNEVRLRTRRIGTLIAMMLMAGMVWLIIADPATGRSMMVANGARVLYTSSAMAIASAGFISALLAFIAFYLVRGRVVEDLRSGIGSVIASTPVSNSLFLMSRWLGGVIYVMTLVFSAMLATIVLQALRGEGPIQVWVYLHTYLAVFFPTAVFVVSMATLFDSVPVLMGKFGDLLYFIIWTFAVGLIAKAVELSAGQISAWALLDFTGVVSTVITVRSNVLTNNFSMGSTPFNASIAAYTLPVMLWSGKLIGLRVITTLLSLLPLLLAIPLFHRYSPDKVKATHSRKRRSPLTMLNEWTRPLAKLVQPLFFIASKSPGLLGQVLSEIALCLVNAPFVLLVLLGVNVAAFALPYSGMHGLMLLGVVFWGVLISDMSTRDFQAGIESMTGVAKGGAAWRYLRHLLAAMVLGVLFVAVVLVKLGMHAPLLAAAFAMGLISVSSLASFFGLSTRTSRTFLSAYLFWVYVATQVPKAPQLDALGFNGVANMESILLQGQIGLVALVLGWFYNLYKAR